MRDRDDAERQKIEIKLYMPPQGEVATTGPWSVESQMAAFHDVKAALMG